MISSEDDRVGGLGPALVAGGSAPSDEGIGTGDEQQKNAPMKIKGKKSPVSQKLF